MNIERMIEEKIISELDLTPFKEQINKTVKDYFASDYFAENLAEALQDQDIASEIAAGISKKLIAGIKSKISISIG